MGGHGPTGWKPRRPAGWPPIVSGTAPWVLGLQNIALPHVIVLTGVLAGSPVRGLGPGILPTQGVFALLTGLCLTRWFPGATRTALGGPGILLSRFRILFGFPALFLNPPCSEYVWLGTKPGTHRLSMEGAPGSLEARSSAFQCVLGLDPWVPCGRDPVGTASRIFWAFGTLTFESGSIPRQR